MQKNIAFLGYGAMGKAIADAIALHTKHNVYVIDNNQHQSNLDNLFFSNIAELIAQKIEISYLFLAIKPQSFKKLETSFFNFISQDTKIFSIMAGIPISMIAKNFTTHDIIRLMPNLAARYKQSTTTGFTDRELSKNSEINQICQSFGSITWLAQEEDMHISTAINGSGPALFTYLFKAINEFATESGLEQKLAKNIITDSLTNSLTIIKAEENYQNIIAAIASKGGTTEAMLKQAEKLKLDEILKSCFQAASTRSKEMN